MADHSNFLSEAQAAAEAALRELNAQEARLRQQEQVALENPGVAPRLVPAIQPDGSVGAHVGSELLDFAGDNRIAETHRRVGGGDALYHQEAQSLHSSIPDDESATRMLQHMLTQQQEAEQRNSMSYPKGERRETGLIGRQSSAPLQDHQRLMLETRQKQQLQQRRRNEQQRKERLSQKQFMTVAQNGTILESTQTITGVRPEALLMTSIFDSIYEDDIPGFMCIKTNFWDKGQRSVPVYIRRQHVETGNFIWISSMAIQYIQQPVTGYVMQEEMVSDELVAAELARITRIAAILIQAVEASLVSIKETAADSEYGSGRTRGDRETYKSLLGNFQASEMDQNEGADVLKDLMEFVATGDDTGAPVVADKVQMEMLDRVKNKSFDPGSLIESVRSGVRLDLGLSNLGIDEVRMVTLVLSGKVPVDQVAPLVYNAVKRGRGLHTAFKEFLFDAERASLPPYVAKLRPPPLAVINLSYTSIGNEGAEILSEALYQEGSLLQTLDVSFCDIDEKGFVFLAKALTKRKRRKIESLRGLLVSGNYITSRSASELGIALSTEKSGRQRKRPRSLSNIEVSGYETEESDDEDEFEGEDADGELFAAGKKRMAPSSPTKAFQTKENITGIQVLHVAHASMTAEATGRLLVGLGTTCTVRELNLSSNYFRAAGATALARFLEGTRRGQQAMPLLDRLDMSNNNLGDDGTAQIARVISKRSQVHNFVDLKLSSNSIGSGGIETIMNKLLQHNLLSLSLSKNHMGDHGCQLVAASIQGMKSLSRLNLGFNQIGCRGIRSLMRSLIGCESITYLNLSGNVVRISGAISLAFTLSQHPRLEELELENCCLGQAAQCHIVAGAISNRWVPMKIMKGFAAGPPMVAIGALEPYGQSLSNEECFRIRKNEQMKTILRWQASSRMAKMRGVEDATSPSPLNSVSAADQRFLSPDFIANMNDVHGTPSQSAYYRLLSWLGQIPFDDDELSTLQKYFYDVDGGEGDRGSDGYINLKLRGDLLAALDSEVADEIREEFPPLSNVPKFSVGLDLDKLEASGFDSWACLQGRMLDENVHAGYDKGRESVDASFDNMDDDMDGEDETEVQTSSLMASKPVMSRGSMNTSKAQERGSKKPKPRIATFSGFEQQLEELKSTATEMIGHEADPVQHEVILTQYAEASLAILRQLRYLCMHVGLDGWRQVGENRQKRKILVVDDSKVARKIVTRAFEKANFIVDNASDGSEGVEKMKASIYDIAFMDIDMPVMNGFEATKELREWEDAMRPGCRQPICALTATYVDDFSKAELMKFKKAGLDVMERKPCNIPRLLKVVDDVSPMFSDLSVHVIQREQSDSSLSASNSTTR